jgi:tRNA(fMet)-specific endonuclease VapC
VPFVRRADHLLLPVVLAFDRRAARIFGTLKADLERAGTPLAEPDLRIAAIAISHQLTLVTRNVRHYGRVPDLTVENWIDVDDHKCRAWSPCTASG